MGQVTRNDEASTSDSFSDNFNPTHPLHPSIATCPSPGAISNLCSATLGAGALSLPYAFSLTGLIPGVLLLLLSGYLTIISIDAIILSCVDTKLYKYEDVAVRLTGRSAGRALEASLLVFCFGTAVAYIVALGDILDQFVRSVLESGSDGKGGESATIYSRERAMILFWVLIMFPLSLQRKMEGLERFSSLGVFSIIFLVLAAVIHSAEHGVILGKNSNGQNQETTNTIDIGTMLWPNSVLDVIQAFPIIIFAFSCQVNVCAIFEELSPRDADCIRDTVAIKERMMQRITRTGIALCITLYLAIGIFGYLDFAHETLDNILKNYNIPVTHDSLMAAASIFVAVAIIVAYPFNILPARVTIKLILSRLKKTKCGERFGILPSYFQIRRSRSSSTDDVSNTPPTNGDTITVNEETNDGLEPLLFGDDYEQTLHIPPLSMSDNVNQTKLPSTDPSTSTMEHFLLTLLLSGSALIVALLIPGISVVFGIMGGTAASVISFILPGMFLRRTGNINDVGGHVLRRKKLISGAFIWGGVVIGVLSTGVTLYGLL